MKQPLTVIVPCKDERLNIRHCIESFNSIADEILIADSGSTDETLDIVREYKKSRVVTREYNFSGDFKNWAIPQAKNEWVLVVDADERVTPELASEIETLLSSEPKQDGYWIYRDNHFLGHPVRYGDAQTDSVMRLFKRDLGRYRGPSDHGEVHISTGRTGFMKHRFMHYTMWSYDDYFRKFHRYTTFQAKQWHDEGLETSWFKLLIRPMFRFFREWILQGSILDGKVGIQTAWLAAMYCFMKQARLWEMNNALERFEAAEEPAGEQSTEQEVDERNSVAA